MTSGITDSGMTRTIPTTILQAVNQMLKAIGRAEIMSLANENMTEDAQSALSMLSDTSVEMQSRGWHFNTDEELLIEPDEQSLIQLPANTISAVVNPRSYPADVTWRGQQLYDRANHTYVFDKPIYVNLTSALPFEQLPQAARWYVMALAGRKFAVGRLPESATFKFTKEVETDAWSALQQYDHDSRSATLPESSPHFASFRRGQRRII
ncbi:hypothetical protein [Methylobacterium marchantiae]|uniref:Tail tubular protein A n=1 Tax=Methylobacterium marchantiae TaxID=600331 RepID=A0ABW3X1H4_9HYPH|nr:hypothetical protein AIGOOFII_3491 [Methylobacterium marchantiae]